MNFLINQYSFIAISILLTLTVGLILFRNKPKTRDFLAFGVIVIGIIFAWVILHPRQTLFMNDAKVVKEMIGAGEPVLLEFQSPY